MRRRRVWSLASVLELAALGARTCVSPEPAMSLRVALAALVPLTYLTLQGCWQTPIAREPSILLVTIDTTRADRIGAYGHALAETPTLDALAEQGVLFENAMAPTPITLPSHATLLTGVHPPAHGVRDNGQFKLSGDAMLVSEVLQERGWRTAAFVGAYVLDARFGLDQGFETYDAPEFAAGSRALGAARPANGVVDAAAAWLQSLTADERFFLWVHLYDPHAPYRPPEPFASRHEDPYDGEIAFADLQLGRLLEALEALGRSSELLTVVTSDHGEAFGEHGETTHGVFVYQTTLRVPLIVSGAALGSTRGTRVPGAVSLAALAPTLLALGGVPGDALPLAKHMPLLTRDGEPQAPDANAPIYVESYLPFYTMHWHALRGIVWRGHKLVLGRSAELFDLTNDPDELVDLADRNAPQVARMRTELERLEHEQRDMGWAETHTPGPEEVARLETLGYAAAPAEGDPLDPSLPDPRQRLEERARFDEADRHWARGRALQQRARAEESEEKRAPLYEAAREQWREARRVIESLETGDDNPMLLELLGKIENTLGRPDRALPALERSVALQPGTASAHFNLGLAYRKLGRGKEAARSFERAYDLEPRQPRFSLMLARQLADDGDADAARPWLARAREQLRPGSSLEPSVKRVEELIGDAGVQ